MNEGHRAHNSRWSTQRVQIGSPPLEYITFTGEELSQGTEIVSQSEEEQRGADYILYRTPREGYKLYLREWLIEGMTEGSLQRRPGERSAEIKVIRRVLYSEEEAKRKHPEIFKALLERTQEED